MTLFHLFITGFYTSFGPFLDCPHFLPYYSVILTVMTQSYWASLGLPFTLSPSALTWPLVFLLMGSCVPFVFSLGHPWPVCFLWASSSLLLTLHSYGLLLTSLDFPDPITSFSSLGFMGLPLTLTFFVCITFEPAMAHSHFFYIIYCPWVCYFSLSELFLSPFTSSKPICLFHEPVIHYSYRLGLMALPLLCQTFAPCCWAFLPSTWILKNDPQQEHIEHVIQQ